MRLRKSETSQKDDLKKMSEFKFIMTEMLKIMNMVNNGVRKRLFEHKGVINEMQKKRKNINNRIYYIIVQISFYSLPFNSF